MSVTFGNEVSGKAGDTGISRKVLSYNNDIMLVEVSVTAGNQVAVHSHPHKQISYVAKGSFEVTINDQNYTLTAGDSFMPLPNEPHGAKALSDGMLIEFFSPIREDFLQ
ncbi:MAG: cupin domain-containing protein [Spirochaetaceae bacterium]|nr:cupin domain-containing protein [Spirochaetaceae bacterium]